MRYFIELAYKGTKYYGWQRQENAITVQQALEKALQLYCRQVIKITGAGRTDTGVHASYFVAHFDLNQDKELDEFKFVKGVNAILPDDIAVYSLQTVADDSHARFHATSRTYKYHLLTQKNPFRKDTTCRIFKDLDIELMNECSNELLKINDFSSFAKAHSKTMSNVCKVFNINWNYNQNEYVFSITADRFLRNMVRAIVGTLLEIGNKKITKNQFLEIIHKKDRSLAGTSVPAQGLFLVDIKYPGHVFKSRL